MDRNFFDIDTGELKIKSLSARRAWIEILAKPSALMLRHSSLSARRAWIEIRFWRLERRKSAGRSPQGERG